MGKLFEGLEGRWKGRWPPLGGSGPEKLEKVTKKGRQVGSSPKKKEKGRQMLASQKRSSNFCGREYGPPPVSK
jgi:hypothetical protein